MKKEITTIGLIIGVLLMVAAVSIPLAAAAGEVTRTLPATATAGSTITVSLAVTVDGATYYAIDEQVPAGWTVTSASDGGYFTADSGHVKWAVITGAADTTYTYTVSIPATASGSYTFTGTYMLEGMTAEANIGGDSSITVTTPTPRPSPTPTPGAAYATRDLPDEVVSPGANFDVGIEAHDYGTFGQVVETLPNGFTYASSTLDPGSVEVVDSTVKFTLFGETSFTYTVTASSVVGTYEFSGILKDADMNEYTVGGDTQVIVQTIGPTPTPTPISTPTPTPTPISTPTLTTTIPIPTPTMLTPISTPTPTPTLTTTTPTPSPTTPTPTPGPDWMIPLIVALIGAVAVIIAALINYLTSRKTK